jgi:hypothetical protein
MDLEVSDGDRTALRSTGGPAARGTEPPWVIKSPPSVSTSVNDWAFFL